MTAPQEAAMRLALAALTSTDALPYEDWMRTSGHPAIKALNAALAQQGEPVAQARLGMKDGLAMALSVVELYGMKGDVIYREIAKLRDGIAAAPAPQAQEAATKNCPQPEICGSKECEFCRDTAASQPAQESSSVTPVRKDRYSRKQP